MAFKIDLFPTELPIGFDTPVPLLKNLDMSGKRCVQYFDEVLAAAQVAPSAPHSADADTLRRAGAAFSAALRDDDTVPVAVSRTLIRNMPGAWDRIVLDARSGKLSESVMLLEAASRTGNDQDDTPASARKHPVTAYIDELGSHAAAAAFASYGAVFESHGDAHSAHQAALNALIGSLSKEIPQDAVQWIQALDPKGFQIVMATAAAGVLASFLVAPRTLLENASALGLSSIPVGHEFHVAQINGQVQVKLGLQVTALTGELANVDTWKQALGTGFSTGASVVLASRTGQFTAQARVSPGQWGLHFSFSGTLV